MGSAGHSPQPPQKRLHQLADKLAAVGLAVIEEHAGAVVAD